MKEADAFNLAAQVRDDSFGQGNDAVFFAFAIAHSDGAVFEVNIFDAQAEAFHQAQAGAIEELGHEFVDAGHAVDDLEGLLPGKDSGETLGAFGRGEEDGGDLFVEDFSVEEKDGAERLVLGRGGDIVLVGKMEKKGLDFGGAHLARVMGNLAEVQPGVMETDETADPIEVGLFGAVGVVFGAQGLADAVKEFGGHQRLTLEEFFYRM